MERKDTMSKLARKDMSDKEKAIFGSRWKAPLLTVLVCVLLLSASFGMFLVMGML